MREIKNLIETKSCDPITALNVATQIVSAGAAVASVYYASKKK